MVKIVRPLPLLALLLLSCSAAKSGGSRKRPAVCGMSSRQENGSRRCPWATAGLAAMVFGRVGTERIQLNEESLWSGKPINTINPHAQVYLSQVRRLLFCGRLQATIWRTTI